MIVIIAVLVGLTIAAAAVFLVPQMVQGPLKFDSDPDTPKPFGLRMSWFAIRTTNIESVVAALGLHAAEPANWDTGIGTVYAPEFEDNYVFVSPPIKGWVFVVGIPLPHPVGRNFVDKCSPLLAQLSKEFGEVQYFCTFPIIDFFGWAKLSGGKMIRAFAIGDEGVVWDRGRLTPDERALGLKLFDIRGIKGRKGDAGGPLILHPTEEHVLRLARAWSIDPMSLGDTTTQDKGLGLIARAPSQWRTERLRKSA